MISAKSTFLELRGIANKMNKSGRMYYVLNVETEDGTPHALYCPNADALPQGLRKGENIVVTFALSSWNGLERYTVTNVERVAE